ncbi:pyruvoyl-dependent arginine decarboxylase [Infirmifilum sp. NZ]|uniref:pyruvoyl-dependent arginine decarboxylase n=1 Tax=Infirmifilum sp. NZ TaxID=2926850 RepID=UPI0027A560D5|nr:pyruvoyl-dependent arginine decarboxylase [Infirmifilum sp. NZ]UNQ72921.1 pyruvoyl-dependent arginine decarboxylase [Infirmifilum sp. NZ]
MIIPRKYFVTKGKGLSKVSPLMAFNNALREAGIHNVNLVPVSSILPPGVEEEPIHPLPPGAVVFVVMSEKRVKGPAKISTGISWARGRPHGYVVEFHDGDSESHTHSQLEAMWDEIRREKNLQIEPPRYLTEELEVPEGYYGSVVVALVFSSIELTP